MILYLESSAILSLYLSETGRHDAIQRELERADSIVCSMIAVVEVRAGLARARFKESPPRLSNAGYRRSLSMFASDWPSYGRIAVSEGIIRDAADLAERRLLRAYDATHLATALMLRARSPEAIEMSTWDGDLAKAAVAEGLSLSHEVAL